MTIYYICRRDSVLRIPSMLGSDMNYDHIGGAREWTKGNESARVGRARRSSRLEAALLHPELVL
jgi:hypothetical protein